MQRSLTLKRLLRAVTQPSSVRGLFPRAPSQSRRMLSRPSPAQSTAAGSGLRKSRPGGRRRPLYTQGGVLKAAMSVLFFSFRGVFTYSPLVQMTQEGKRPGCLTIYNFLIHPRSQRSVGVTAAQRLSFTRPWDHSQEQREPSRPSSPGEGGLRARTPFPRERAAGCEGVRAARAGRVGFRPPGSGPCSGRPPRWKDRQTWAQSWGASGPSR